jgi:ATP-dependent protease ClpP protease subunit
VHHDERRGDPRWVTRRPGPIRRDTSQILIHQASARGQQGPARKLQWRAQLVFKIERMTPITALQRFKATARQPVGSRQPARAGWLTT